MVQMMNYNYQANMAKTDGAPAAGSDAGSFATPLYMNLLPSYGVGMVQTVPNYVVPGQVATPSPPPEPVSAPTYEKASANFGTMRHVEPVRDHLINAFLTLEKLRLFAADTPGTEAPLLARVEEYLKKHMGEKDYQALLDGLGITIPPPDDTSFKLAMFVDPKLKSTVGEQARKISGRFFRQQLPKIGELTNVALGDVVDKPAEVKSISVTHNTHSALFSTGRVMADDIRTMEALRHALVKVRRDQQRLLEKEQARLAELEERIGKERATLGSLEARRAETLDDYIVAQRLLAEHWQEIEARYAERKRIIESNVGLYYVRVRETPMSLTLPDPLDLRPGNADDLVPGCPSRSTPLAVELRPFMANLLDIPAADWAVLRDLSKHLPGRSQLDMLVQQRRQRIQIRLQQPAVTQASFSRPALLTLLQNHQSMAQAIAARPFAMAGLRDMQQQGHHILALEDLMGTPIPALRDPSNQLHQRLNTAAGCLLDRLQAIKPSLRLAWADLADDNRLPVENPERWPNLDQAEADDFNNLRTLVELIGWWFRQLDANASGDSRTAMRNFIRACLLLAANDDPQQLLQGQLRSLPSRFRAGELLRLDLNREPAPGNLLHLLDDRQQVVATVRVEDHDSNGTLASIATVINPNVTLSLALRVTGQRK